MILFHSLHTCIFGRRSRMVSGMSLNGGSLGCWGGDSRLVPISLKILMRSSIGRRPMLSGIRTGPDTQ